MKINYEDLVSTPAIISEKRKNTGQPMQSAMIQMNPNTGAPFTGSEPGLITSRVKRKTKTPHRKPIKKVSKKKKVCKCRL
jgi:hypothetical protein